MHDTVYKGSQEVTITQRLVQDFYKKHLNKGKDTYCPCLKVLTLTSGHMVTAPIVLIVNIVIVHQTRVTNDEEPCFMFQRKKLRKRKQTFFRADYQE